jgi:pantothenate kinase-related protein Tda10
LLAERGIATAVLGLDDFYLTRARKPDEDWPGKLGEARGDRIGS